VSIFVPCYFKKYCEPGIYVYITTSDLLSYIYNRYKSGVILVLDVRKEVQVLQRLRGHDEEVHCVVWCPISGEDYKMSVLQTDDVVEQGKN